MDWTLIITALISMISAIAVAYISRATKKSNDASNSVVQEKFAKIEGRLNVFGEKLSGLEEKICHQNDKLDAIDKRLQDQESANLTQQAQLTIIRDELSDNNLRTMRLDLVHAIENDPDNTIVIMELAQKYFVEMKGNCYMSKVFQDWANDHNVNITGLFNQG